MYWAKRHQRPIQLFQLFPNLSAQTSIKILQITLSTLCFDILGRAVDGVTGTDLFGALPVFSCLSQLAFNEPRSKDVQPLLSWVVSDMFQHVSTTCEIYCCHLLPMYIINCMRIHVPDRLHLG